MLAPVYAQVVLGAEAGRGHDHGGTSIWFNVLCSVRDKGRGRGATGLTKADFEVRRRMVGVRAGDALRGGRNGFRR